MNKIVIIINGAGKSGKDTICNIVAKYFDVKTISTIDPIKTIARVGGWADEKDDRSRLMLAELKQVFIKYNDLPTNYAIGEIEKFVADSNEILFIHVREKNEIEKLIKKSPMKIYTLLIKRNNSDYTNKVFGNAADDEVDNYCYDFCYVSNNASLEELEKDFMKYFYENIKK